MAGTTVLIGVANESEINVEVDVIKNWEISKIIYFSDIVYFKYNDIFHSMKRKDFNEIFKK